MSDPYYPDPYHYEPLPTGKPWIRLIRLNVGRSTPLDRRDDHGDIVSFPLDDAPVYLTLSYSREPRAVRYNSSVCFGSGWLRVSGALRTALDQLATSRSGPTYLWVRELCVNRADRVEKASQDDFEHIQKVLAGTASVFVTLGPEYDDSDVAMEWIDHYGGLAEKYEVTNRPGFELSHLMFGLDNCDDCEKPSGERRVKRTPQDKAYGSASCPTRAGPNSELATFINALRVQLKGESDEDRRTLTALQSLFKRPYWDRIWALHELGQDPDKINFVCGNKSVPSGAMFFAARVIRDFPFNPVSGKWSHMKACLQALGQAQPGSDKEPIKIPTFKVLRLLKTVRSERPLELAYLLRYFWSAKGDDPRDKVYALLGSARDTLQLNISVDYDHKTAGQLFTETTMALYRTGYTDLLSYCKPHEPKPSNSYAHGPRIFLPHKFGDEHQYESKDEDEDLPSWVPRYDEPFSRERIQQRALVRIEDGVRLTTPMLSELQPAFAASDNCKGRFTFSEEEGKPGPRVMSCQVIKLGQVRSVGNIYQAGRQEAVGEWLQDLLDRARQYISPAPDGDESHSDQKKRRDEQLRAVLRTAVADQEKRHNRPVKPRLSEKLLDEATSVFRSEDLTKWTVEDLLYRPDVVPYVRQIEACAPGRRCFAGEGLFGIGPCEMQVGDWVCVILGATVPYVLRQDFLGKLSIVGDAYVYGKMDGEAMDGSFKVQEVKIY